MLKNNITLGIPIFLYFFGSEIINAVRFALTQAYYFAKDTAVYIEMKARSRLRTRSQRA